jgi:hypothetical protein
MKSEANVHPTLLPAAKALAAANEDNDVEKEIDIEIARPFIYNCFSHID